MFDCLTLPGAAESGGRAGAAVPGPQAARGPGRTGHGTQSQPQPRDVRPLREPTRGALQRREEGFGGLEGRGIDCLTARGEENEDGEGGWTRCVWARCRSQACHPCVCVKAACTPCPNQADLTHAFPSPPLLCVCVCFVCFVCFVRFVCFVCVCCGCCVCCVCLLCVCL